MESSPLDYLPIEILRVVLKELDIPSRIVFNFTVSGNKYIYERFRLANIKLALFPKFLCTKCREYFGDYL